MVVKVIIEKKMSCIKSTVSEKKEHVNDKIREIKDISMVKKDNIEEEPGKWRKLAPKLFV